MTLFAPCWCNFSTLFCLFSWFGKTLHQIALPLRQSLCDTVYALPACRRILFPVVATKVIGAVCTQAIRGSTPAAALNRTGGHEIRSTSSPGLFTHFLREKPWGRGWRSGATRSLRLDYKVVCWEDATAQRLSYRITSTTGIRAQMATKSLPVCSIFLSFKWRDSSKIKLLFLNKKHGLINQFTTYKY